MTDNQTITQPIDAMMTSLNLSNADLVKASTEQLTFKMMNKARGGKRISPNVQEKILNALLKLKPELKLKCRDLFYYEAGEDIATQIKNVLSLAKKKQISYPQFIDALAGLGVTAYKAEVASNRYTFYIAGGESYIEQGEKISDASVGIYNKEAISLALKDVQNGKIDHPVFLKRIYEAGIVTYEVNIRHRYIRYMGLDHSFREDIPAVGAVIEIQKPTPSL